MIEEKEFTLGSHSHVDSHFPKILSLKSLYNLSGDSTELMIRDRISFMEFLGLSFADTVPGAKTIWLFAEPLKEFGLERKLFEQFEKGLIWQGFAAKGDYIVDDSFVEAPKQRNTKEENTEIKAGNIPKMISENPNVFAQKDGCTLDKEERHFVFWFFIEAEHNYM